jgi:hypothetical protein
MVCRRGGMCAYKKRLCHHVLLLCCEYVTPGIIAALSNLLFIKTFAFYCMFFLLFLKENCPWSVLVNLPFYFVNLKNRVREWGRIVLALQHSTESKGTLASQEFLPNALCPD